MRVGNAAQHQSAQENAMDRCQRLRLSAGLLLGLAVPSAYAADAGAVSVGGCWVRALPGQGAAYFEVDNGNDHAVTITEADMQGYAMAMLHQTRKVGDMMTMSEVRTLQVPAHGKVRFAPGGYHLMLMDAKADHAAGDRLQLTLTLGDRSKASAACEVKSPDSMGP
jgi:copper(I)-binding protein